jgi:hypothetical protein
VVAFAAEQRRTDAILLFVQLIALERRRPGARNVSDAIITVELADRSFASRSESVDGNALRSALLAAVEGLARPNVLTPATG